jgi:ribulose-phosphate 3-epimerase
MKVRIAPSILASDFGRLADQVVEAEEAGVDWIHVDVMDGHFVPNITIGPAITEAVRRATGLPVDVHLMIEAPDRYIQAFADAGADYLTVHQETCPHLHRTIQRIRAAGVRPGVAINPATPVESVAAILPDIDLLLVMSVNPGFGGQAFIPSALGRLARARELLDACGGEGTALEVDGGIDPTTAPEVAGAGADVLVAGSAIYGHPQGVAAGVSAIRNAVETPGG